MTPTVSQPDPLRSLADRYCDGSLSADETIALEQRLRDDPQAMNFFVLYMEIHSQIAWNVRARIEQQELGNEQREPATPASCVVTAAPLAADPAFPSPIHPSSFALHPSAFSPSSINSVLFSYCAAAVLLGTALTLAWAWKLPDHAEYAHQSIPGQSSPVLSPTQQSVGRITDTANCRCVHGTTLDSRPSAPVPLGSRFALASGLLEITYDTGAKVILEGPCTYEVSSRDGGYLSVGKLVARVEKREEGRGEREEAMANPKSQILDHQISNPSLAPSPSPLFSITTPTATVTDLGTEFGVEVAKTGGTSAHVFRGSVSVQAISNSTPDETDKIVLTENESARVELNSDEPGAGRVAVNATSIKPADFVRAIPHQIVKRFDLVDVVAGGDGFSGHRGRGINPTNGQPTGATVIEPSDAGFFMLGDGKYHRCESMPLVDGVFIPNGRSGDVQVDSAGHTFADFRETANKTPGIIWAGGVIPAPSYSVPPNVSCFLESQPPSHFLLPTKLGNTDYASAGHGSLFMHADNAITFSLDAIRRANPGAKILRFRATTGSTEPMAKRDLVAGHADVWVLVDGQPRFRRREINGASGNFSILFSISDNDHFLTLASTDSGDDIAGDWILFGDPVLEMVTNTQKGK